MLLPAVLAAAMLLGSCAGRFGADADTDAGRPSAPDPEGDAVGDGDDIVEGGTVGETLAFRRGRPSIKVVEPADGAVVWSPIRLQVDASNLKLTPAGRAVDGEGHLHVLIDQPCLPSGTSIEPADDTLDLDRGTDTVDLDLGPGTYDLCVQVGDGFDTAVAVVDTVQFTVTGVRSDPDDPEG